MTPPTPPAPRRSRARRARVAGLAAVVLAAATVVVVATTGSEPAGAGPPPVMHAFVPLPTDDFQEYLESINAAADPTIAFTVGITNAAAGATITYDHHEDGFEADIANPVQSSTLVLGDGDAGNGNAGTYCTACAGDLLPQGAPLIMRSTIPTPRNTADRFFDGGDEVASTRGITITAGGFSTPLNSLLSGVVSAYDTSKYDTAYTVPVGEDTPFPAGTTDAFSYTGASIMAATAGTVVDVDADGDGDVDSTQTIGAGRTRFVDGGLSEGATIRSSRPVQVHLLTGQAGSNYEARSFTLYPDDVLSNDYMSPAGSGRTNVRTVNYLYNPTATPLVVTPTCTGCSGTITVPAGASAAFHSPTGQAVRFSTTGARFIAIAGVGAQSGAAPGGGANDARVYDWGFSMLPTSQLTTQVALGWAPGNSNVPATNAGVEESYDPVWVTTLTATTVHVDYDGNPATGGVTTADCFGARHDTDIPVAALASTRIFDPDGDMTGARVYTCDGTKIAGAWGQDPTTAPTGAPGFDAGYTIIPTTTMVLEKTARTATDVDGDGGVGPGDTLTYEIAIADAGSLAFTDVEAEDVLPVGLEYVPGSTRLVSGTTTTPYADDGPPAATPFPLDEGGVGLPDISAGQTVYLRFEAAVVEPWVDDAATVGNTACVRAAEATACDTSSTTLTTADVSLTKIASDPPEWEGDEAHFEIRVANAGPDVAPGVEVTDLLPAGLTFNGAGPSQGTYDPATGIWSVGAVGVGEDEVLDLYAVVEDDAPITNVAEVTGGSFVDPDSTVGNGATTPTEDDRDGATVDVGARIDLELGKAVSAEPTADGTTEFTLTLDNVATADATGVVVGERLPGDATFVSATPSVGSYDPVGGQWDVGTVAGGGTETLVVAYRYASFPTVNRAQVVEADQPDVDSEPNEDVDLDPNQDDEAAVDVTSGWTDVRVDKTVTSNPWMVGSDVTFTVEVQNEGASGATGVEVTDQLPDDLDLVSATPSQGTYDPVSGLWVVGDLLVEERARLEVVATITAPGPQVNIAQVTALDQQDVDSTPDAVVDGEDDEGQAGVDGEGRGRIGDRVWDDLDGDGAQDPGEPGLAGVDVHLDLDLDGDGSYETGRGSVTTGADGAYLFEDIDDGAYRVTVDPATVPGGRVATTDVPLDIDLALDEVVLDADLGFSAAADLAIDKAVLSVGAFVGDRVTYRVTVADDGPADATGVVVEDLLPAGLAFVSADPSQGTYDPTTGRWSVGTVVDGGTATLDITATTTSAAPITNAAAVAEVDQPDPDGADDGDDATIDVDPQVDLSLTKELTGPAPTHVGDEAAFTVTVANAGPSTATDVEVTDLLPAGLGFLSASAEAGDYDVTTGVWSVGELDAGEDLTLDLVATVDEVAVTNTAEVTAAAEPDADSTPGNGATTPAEDDRATVDVEVEPLVDLSVEKEGTSPAAIGQVASFEVDVTNRGPSVATGVEVTDLLPTGLTLVSATPSAGTYDPTTGVWAVGPVAVDGVETLAVTATLDVPGPITNAAELTAVDQDDADADDDRATAEVGAPGASIGDRVWDDLDGDGTQDAGEPGLIGVDLTLLDDAGDPVSSTTTGPDGAYLFDGLAPGAYQVVVDEGTVPPGHVATTPTTIDVTLAAGQELTTADAGFSGGADLRVSKELTSAPSYVGDTATFTVRVTNLGPATATGVVVADPQPPGLLFQDADASQGSLDGDTGEWTVGTLADGASATLELDYRIDVPGVLANVAEVVAVDQDDPTSTPGNADDEPDEDDTGTATVDVDDLVDLSVTKDEVGDPTYLGQRAVFEITVANAGPSVATAVAVTDRLPEGLTFVSADAEVGTYDDATGIWAVGEVAAGTSYTLEVRAQVDALNVTNTAEVTGAAQDDADSEPGNGATAPGEDDTAAVAVTVAPRADLSLVKTGTSPEAVGQTATFTVTVANGGPSLATGVQVTDRLPAGLTFVSATPGAGTYDPATGIWTIGAVPVDGSVTLTVTARLDVLGPVVNGAEVTAVDQADPDSTPGNRSTAPDEDDGDTAAAGAGGGSIGDRVWDDRDADGTQDAGEPGLVGVDVTLLDDADDPVATTTTGPDGAYLFEDLVPGAYRVVVDGDTVPEGHVATTPTTVAVTLAPGADVDDADVGFSGVVDLRLDKTLTAAPDAVGDTATFAVVVTNDGPATATGVVVADELPTGLDHVSATATQGTYDPGTGRWSVGTLAAGADATLTLVVTVGEETAVNTAEVVAVDQDDPTSTPGNAEDEPDEDDTDTATVDVDALVDLAVIKELTEAPTHIGDEATFTVTVANTGPSTATGVEVTDLLPDGLALVSATPGAGSYDQETGVWTVGSVAPDDTETLVVVATVEALTATNTAEVTTADQADADSEPDDLATDPGEDDADTVDVVVAPLVDLSLAKSEIADPTHLGDIATFVITVANAGPSAATGVQVADVLPAGLSFVSASATSGTYDATTGIWSLPTIGADRSATITLRATVTALSVVNAAEVVAVAQDDADSEPGENALGPDDPADQDDEDTVLVEVDARVDVSVDKVETANPVVVGDEAAFTITVANAGPATATAVEVTDQLPEGLTFVSADAEVGTYDEASGSWAVGDLAPGTDATLEVRAVVGGLTVTNVAEVTATAEDDADSTPANGDVDPAEDDRDQVEVTVEPRIDLSLDKVLTSTPTHLGDRATFTLTVANDGPSPATDVEVTDLLPAGLVHVSDDGGGAYDPVTGVWAVGTVGPLATRTLAVTATVEALEVENRAEVSDAAEVDVDSAPLEDPLGPDDPPDQDDEAAAAVTVAPLADLSLTKTSSPATVDQGDEATFTVTVADDGPSDATGVEVTDLLPVGVTLVSSDPSQGTYDPVTGVWAVGTVPDGDTATLAIVVTVDVDAPVANVAEITAVAEDDPDSTPGDGEPGEDDRDTSTVASDPLVDLRVDKQASSPDAAVGDEVTFTVTVANDGPSDATGVELTDVLPTGLTLVDQSAGQGTWDPATGVWAVGPVPVGGSATLEVTAEVTAAGPITNTAEVTAADQADVDSIPGGGPADEDDIASATVGGVLVDLQLGITADATRVDVGDTVTYAVVVADDGPSAATGVTVADPLPDGLAFVSADAEVGSYDPATGTWTIGDLAVGGTVTLEIAATVLVGGPITNEAQIGATVEPDVDSTPANDDPSEDDQDAVTVTGLQVDLGLTKTVDATAPGLGDEVTYTLTLTNAGPSTATGVEVEDGLPEGLRWVDDSSGGAYDPDTGVWSIGSLAAGSTVAIDITTRVVGTGPLTNEAAVAGVDQPDIDSTPGNDDPDEDDQDAVTITPLTASIAGTVWLDDDGDGARDDGEAPIEGVTVLLFTRTGDLVGSALTAADGGYRFAAVAPGDAIVVVDEWTLPDVVLAQTYDPDEVADGAHPLSLAAGEARTGVDFGYQPAPAAPPDDATPDDLGYSPADLLARTGLDPATPVSVGLGLLLAGAVAIALARRRLHRHRP